MPLTFTENHDDDVGRGKLRKRKKKEANETGDEIRKCEENK